MKKNPISILLIIIGCLTMIFTGIIRFNIESKNKVVEFILDYEEIKELAEQSDKDIKWWFEKFRDLGVTSVAINEETLKTLAKENIDLQIAMVENIIKTPDWQDKYNDNFIKQVTEKEIDKYDLVVTSDNKSIIDFIKAGLEKRYPSNFYKVFTDNNSYIIVIDGKKEEALYLEPTPIEDVTGKSVGSQTTLISSKVADIGLGFDKTKVNLIKSAGLNVIPRPINYSRYPDKLVDAFIDEVSTLGIESSVMIFGGKEVLGFEEFENKTVKYMRDNNIKVGLIESSVQREHIEQEGIEELVEKLDYNAVRIFSIWSYIQERYKYYNYEGAEEIENSLYRAITERNIRIIYFKPFKEDSFKYVTDYNEYERTFRSLKERLNRHGISIGEFTTMEPFKVNPLRLSLLGLGLVGFGILLLSYFIPVNRKTEAILTSLGIISTFGLVHFVPSIADKILSLGAAIIFPSLSLIYLMKKIKAIIISVKEKTNIFKVISDSVITLLICSFISIIGGLYVGTILSDIKYLIEMDIFRGVKLSQLLPLVLFVLFYLSEFGFNRKEEKLGKSGIKWNEMAELYNLNIKLKYVIFSIIILIAGYIYIARTGHETSVQPSDIEMIVRNFLENTLLARPRTKEFLGAFPALMGCIFIAHKGWRKLIFPLGIAAAIGQTSIVNTFSHLRTPLYLSIVRTIYSLGFGIILAIISILIVEGVTKVVFPLKGDKTNE